MSSPIERMIDAACGVPKDRSAPVLMRCPDCGKEKQAPRHWTDPVEAVVVVFPCGECGPNSHAVPHYLDASGAMLFGGSGEG